MGSFRRSLTKAGAHRTNTPPSRIFRIRVVYRDRYSGRTVHRIKKKVRKKRCRGCQDLQLFSVRISPKPKNLPRWTVFSFHKLIISLFRRYKNFFHRNRRSRVDIGPVELVCGESPKMNQFSSVRRVHSGTPLDTYSRSSDLVRSRRD